MIRKLSAIALLAVSYNAFADRLDSIITKNPISLYSGAEDTAPTKEVSIEEFKKLLPLDVITEQDERVKILFNQQQFWTRSAAFKINRNCKSVAVVASKSSTPTAVIRGVGKEGGCTK